MVPVSPMQTTDVRAFDDFADKVDNGYAGAPITPNAPMEFSSKGKCTCLSRFAVQNTHVRECLAELLGTFVMLVFGLGVNNQVANSEEEKGSNLSISICWGIGVLIGMYCSVGISGVHLNPAVTLALCVNGRLPWWKALGYMISQVRGAFLGTFVIWVMQWQNLNAIDPNRETTQINFATYPSDEISNYTAFYMKFVGTGMLVLSVYAFTDQRNHPAGPVGSPFAFAFMIMGMVGLGYAVNPARDLGPRIFTAIAGWGSKMFTTRNYYFWIPLVADFVGGVCGASLYRVLVEIHHPPQQ